MQKKAKMFTWVSMITQLSKTSINTKNYQISLKVELAEVFECLECTVMVVKLNCTMFKLYITLKNQKDPYGCKGSNTSIER